MNYFAHGYRFVGDDPYFLAGTAVPDWLCVVDRRMRINSKHAVARAEDEDPRVAALARGIVQHHADDRWFHQTAAFAELHLHLVQSMRHALPEDQGFRPSFLGHILVEILLDAALIQEQPQRAESYYAAMEQLDRREVERIVNQLASRTSERIGVLLERFCQERFLFDYLDDRRLLDRLNMVMRRVNLSPLPAGLAEVLPGARQAVGNRKEALLAGCREAAHHYPMLKETADEIRHEPAALDGRPE